MSRRRKSTPIRPGLLAARALLGVLGSLAALAPSPAAACAVAPPLGRWVEVSSEAALVVWDASAKTQHFVRRAVFRGEGGDFGFLVPTPSRPELGTVPSHVFDDLADLTRPRVVHRGEPRVEVGSCFTMFLRGADKAAPTEAAAVRVLEQARVGGYDAAVLEADDPGALARWLTDHGYADRPALADWLAPYVAQRWILTAFKIAPAEGATAGSPIGTESVRMSFRTERPFFPYREPADQRAPGAEGRPAPGPRKLLLYVLAEDRMSATLGESGAFPGSVPVARRGAAPASLATLAAGLGERPFLTLLVDDSSPRQGTDELWLQAAGEQGEVEPPPIVQVHGDPVIPIVIEPLLLIGIVAIALLARRRTKSARAGGAPGAAGSTLPGR